MDPRLEEAEFFRALSPEQLAQVRPRVALRRLARGQVLYLEGQPADHLWAVCSGEVRLYNHKNLIHTLKLDEAVTAVRMGPYGREEAAMVLCTRSGSQKASWWYMSTA